MKNITLNGVGNYWNGYWFPKDYYKPRYHHKGKDIYYVWPDGERVKKWLTTEEKLVDYTKRMDALLSLPYGQKIVQLYRDKIADYPNHDGKALPEYLYEEHIRPVLIQEQNKFKENQHQIIQQERVQKRIVVKQEKKHQLEKQIRNKNLSVYVVAGVATVSIVGLGYYFFTKKHQ